MSFIWIAAIGQGLFLIASLLTQRRLGVQSRYLLAGLLAVFVLLLSHALALDLLWYERAPWILRSVAALPLLVGPLAWLYLACLLEGRRLARRDGWHGLPALLLCLIWLPVMLGVRPGLPWLGMLIVGSGLFKLCHLAVYGRLAWQILDRSGTSALRRLALALAIGLGLAGLSFLLEQLDATMPVWSDKLAALALTAFVYGLALVSLRLPEAPQAEKPRYATHALDQATRASALPRLQACMEELQLFRDGELSLAMLAERVALTEHELSQLINSSFGVNFQEYVNGFRLAAFKALLRDPARASASVLELGVEAGFNSKSAMNRVFKKATGTTPSAYRSSLIV